MNVQEQITEYIASQPQAKQADLHELHKLILKVAPAGKLWFLDGKDDSGKVISNPNIGYGSFIMSYANGTSKESFQLSISANTTGISLYIIGITDKTYLKEHFAETLGKASITGYCIKFKALKDIDPDVLKQVIQYGFEAQK